MLRDDPEFFLQDNVDPDEPSIPKVHNLGGMTSATCPGLQDVHAVEGGRQIMDPPEPLNNGQVPVIARVMLKRKTPKIRVLSTELLDRNMMPLPGTITQLTGETMSRIYPNPIPIVRQDLTHLRTMEFIPVSDGDEGIENLRMIAKEESQKEEMEQELDVATLDEKTEPEDDSKIYIEEHINGGMSQEYVEEEDFKMKIDGDEMKVFMPHFQAYGNQAGLKD